MKSKGIAAVLAFFLGGIGAHKFYLDQTGKGVLYLIFFWTGIPALIALFEFIVLLLMGEQEFNQKYNQSQMQGQGGQGQQQIGQNVTVNVPGNGGSDSSNVGDELEKLHRLHDKGALSDQEFQQQKQKLLSS